MLLKAISRSVDIRTRPAMAFSIVNNEFRILEPAGTTGSSFNTTRLIDLFFKIN
jgi:hypothetical protein